MITNDEKFEDLFKTEQMIYMTKYVNFEKIKLHIPSFQYLVKELNGLDCACSEETFRHVLSKKNLFESKNAKKLCRSGVSVKYMRDLLLKMFNVFAETSEESFQNKFVYVFKERDPSSLEDYVPYFTAYKTLRESLPVHFLNENGIQALKEILWMLNSVLPFIEYSPLIIRITSVLLIFCSQAETYEIMRSLLEMNYNITEIYKIRWHVRFTFHDNIKLVSSLCECITGISQSGKDSFSLFESINFCPELFYEDIANGFLLEYLNFYGIVRLLPFFMLEGMKSLYRMSYALVKVLKVLIPTVTSPGELLKIFREKSKGIIEISKLFELSFSLKLTRFNNKYNIKGKKETEGFSGRRSYYYLPSFSVVSYIFKESEIVKLWSMLPVDLKNRDAKLIYTSESCNRSLVAIYELYNKYDHESVVMFIIDTTSGEAFGGIISTLIKDTDGKFINPGIAILFSVRPHMALFYAEKEYEEILFCDKSSFVFGNGHKGPALKIDSALTTGISYPENCFGSPSMTAHQEEFTIKKFEIYILG